MAGLLNDLFGVSYDTPIGAVNLGQYPLDTALPPASSPNAPTPALGTTSPNVQTSPNGPPTSDMSAQVMGAAPPGIAPSSSDVSQNQDPITIQGDPWKPVHRNLLGRIGDIMAGRPIYEQRMRDRDMADAMKVWDPENPQATIRRIAQIPGMAQTAINLSEKFGDESDKQEARNVRNAAKEMVIGDRIGAMAGAANAQNWPAMRQQMVKMLGVWGKTPEDYDIPQNFDPTWADAASKGAISAAKQAQMAQQQQHQIQEESIQTQRLSIQRQNEQDRNDHFDIQQQGRDTRSAKPFSYADPDFVKKAGGPAIISGDRMHMIVTKPDGTQWGFQNAGDANGRTNWTPLGETAASIKKRQAAAAAAQGQ